MCTRRLLGRMCTVNPTHGTRYAVNTHTVKSKWAPCTCTIFNTMKINNNIIMLITVLFSMKRKGMPKALLHMQVHVCVCVCVCHGCVCEGGIHVCVCTLWKGHWVEYSVPCPSKSPLPWHTYIITHSQWRRASHPHISAHTHTHCAGHLHTSFAQHMYAHTWSMHPDMPTQHHKQPSMTLYTSVYMWVCVCGYLRMWCIAICQQQP